MRNPAQETSKRYTSWETMGVMQPKILLLFPGTCHIRYFRNKLFLTSRHPLSKQNRICAFRTKSYLRSEILIEYKFYALYPQTTAFLEGNFCLCIENVMRVLNPFFLHINHGVRNTLRIQGFRCHIWPKTFFTWNHIDMFR